MGDAAEKFGLQSSECAFLQDLYAWTPRSATAPGCRRLSAARVVIVRHRTSSMDARRAMKTCGLPWPSRIGALELTVGQYIYITARRQPDEVMVIQTSPLHADELLVALAPGRSSDAVSLDLSHGMLVIAMEGPDLELWLRHSVDACAIPREVGGVTRARLGDIAVLMMRLGVETIWLTVDRAVAPYVANWLDYTHKAAFPEAAAT